ncbi:MAG: thiol peroxidase [Candidatus Brocadiia bacterium]
MTEHRTVTLEGQQMRLSGTPLEAGDQTPEFTVVDNELNHVSSRSMCEGPCVISSVVSLDTPVCDQQARRFNEEALSLSDDLNIYVISMDLPFAQERWCGAEGIERVQTLSDHRNASFGRGFGILIEELRLLARATFVVDEGSTIQFTDIVDEVTDHPDYDSIFNAVKKVT